MTLISRDLTTARARATWAKSIDGLLDELVRPQPLLRSLRPLYRREVARACAHSLTEIRLVLSDRTATVRPEAMRRLREFLHGRSELAPVRHGRRARAPNGA